MLSEEKDRVKTRPIIFIASLGASVVFWGLMIIICCKAMRNIERGTKRLKIAGIYSFIFNILLFFENSASLAYFGYRGYGLVTSDKDDENVDGFVDFGLAFVGFIIVVVVLIQITGYFKYRRAIVNLKRQDMDRGFVANESFDNLSVKDLNVKDSFEDF